MEEKALVQEVSIPIYQSKSWMKFLGVMLIIYGVVSVLSIIGILWCWLFIWLGVLLFKAAGSVELAQLHGEKMQLIESLRKIKTFFVINGILVLIGLIFVVVMLIVSGGTFLSMMHSFS